MKGFGAVIPAQAGIQRHCPDAFVATEDTECIEWSLFINSVNSVCFVVGY